MGWASAQVLGHYEGASRLEWVESDGVGGVASSTYIGVNTRKQHALLAMDLDTRGRCVLVSSVQETILHDDRSFDLSTNAYFRAVHPEGYRNLVTFTTEPWPIWRYQFGDIELERQFFLVNGEHTAILVYRLIGGASSLKFQARPMLAFRRQNVVRRSPDWSPANWQVTHEFAECKPHDDFPAVYFAHPNATAYTVPLWYYDFLYERDRESSVDCIEDLFSPGCFEFDLEPGRPQSIVISSPSPRSTHLTGQYMSEERGRRQRATKPGAGTDPFMDRLVRCARLVRFENEDGRPRIYEGLPWGEADFRSGLTAMPGILLGGGQLDAARDYLTDAIVTWRDTWDPKIFQTTAPIAPGSSLDAPLWLYVAAWRFWEATHDREFLGNILYPGLESIAHEFGFRYGLVNTVDGLIAARGANGDLTLVLSTNALWYSALNALATWASELKRSKAPDWRNAFERTQQEFLKVFARGDDLFLANAVSQSAGWRDESLRSSQLLAVGLPFPVISDTGAIMARVQRELATPLGLRSLSFRDPAYVGDGSDIRFLPRRWSGSIDPGYFGVYCDALRRAGRLTELTDVLAAAKTSFTNLGRDGFPGAFTGDAPHTPCDFEVSASAVGEMLRVYTQRAGAAIT